MGKTVHHHTCTSDDRAQLLQRETPKIIPPDVWPPNSPDLSDSLVDDVEYGMMRARVHQTPVRTRLI